MDDKYACLSDRDECRVINFLGSEENSDCPGCGCGGMRV